MTTLQCLDTGHEFIFGTSEDKTIICLSFGEALLQMLQSLPISLVPAHMHERCSFATDRDEAFEVSWPTDLSFVSLLIVFKIISELPGHSLNVRLVLSQVFRSVA